ncbi:hypothetical protein [Streptomyces sp. NPDC023838]|uniref:hypothetical protein n=1 Tax=Streptomyces sp. NPDC023838 TaxID=3154325 RepID=UPI0033F4BA1B
MDSNADVYREMSTDYLKQRISSYGAVTADLSARGWDPKLADTGHDEINLMISELERRGELS